MKRSRRALAFAAGLAMAASACASLNRDAWQQPDAVIALLGVDPGDVVLELGPADGYFTLRLADAVGTTGLVLGLGREDDAYDSLKREEGTVDLLFTFNTYHQIADPTPTFRGWLDHLAPNGRVAIIEFDGRSGWPTTASGNFTPAETIEREMREAGYERIAKYDLLDRQSFQIFRADDGTGE